jgi:predicted peroxiredoxin
MENREDFLIILSHGMEDDGSMATLAFACANTALAMGFDTTVFLAGKGVHWGYKNAGTTVQLLGFAKLQDLIDDFLKDGGHMISCGTCYKNCVHCENEKDCILLEGVEIGGFGTAIDLAKRGGSLCF